MTLTHPELGFEGHRSFPSSTAQYTAQSAYFMNRETTDNIIVPARNTEVDNNKIHKALFVNLRHRYVTDMRVTQKNIPEMGVS